MFYLCNLFAVFSVLNRYYDIFSLFFIQHIVPETKYRGFSIGILLNENF